MLLRGSKQENLQGALLFVFNVYDVIRVLLLPTIHERCEAVIADPRSVRTTPHSSHSESFPVLVLK